MSNEGTSIRAMSDISDGAAFNNGHRQHRHRQMEGGEKVSRVERSDDGDGWKSRERKERQSGRCQREME